VVEEARREEDNGRGSCPRLIARPAIGRSFWFWASQMVGSLCGEGLTARVWVGVYVTIYVVHDEDFVTYSKQESMLYVGFDLFATNSKKSICVI
jgi:hypothetical protein